MRSKVVARDVERDRVAMLTVVSRLAWLALGMGLGVMLGMLVP